MAETKAYILILVLIILALLLFIVISQIRTTYKLINCEKRFDIRTQEINNLFEYCGCDCSILNATYPIVDINASENDK